MHHRRANEGKGVRSKIERVSLSHDDTAVGEIRTEEQEANETPNARVAATLKRILDGTEPLYGPFKNGEECIAAALAMAD